MGILKDSRRAASSRLSHSIELANARSINCTLAGYNLSILPWVVITLSGRRLFKLNPTDNQA